MERRLDRCSIGGGVDAHHDHSARPTRVAAALLIAAALAIASTFSWQQHRTPPAPLPAGTVGAVDTPAGEVIIGSAIRVTGWALDLAGVRVQLLAAPGYFHVYPTWREKIADLFSLSVEHRIVTMRLTAIVHSWLPGGLDFAGSSISATCSGSITQLPYGRKGRSPGPRPMAQWRRRAVGRATHKYRRFDHTQPPPPA
jgi:hypothetical protein